VRVCAAWTKVGATKATVQSAGGKQVVEVAGLGKVLVALVRQCSSGSSLSPDHLSTLSTGRRGVVCSEQQVRHDVLVVGLLSVLQAPWATSVVVVLDD
jgi:hypothetical protein